MRDSTFDIMKGIAIIAMILGHTNIPLLASDFIFVWHMPLFFIVSGYFYKPYPVAHYVKRNARQLLLPYVLTCIAIVGLTYIKDVISGDNNVINKILAALLGNGTENNVAFKEYEIGAIWFLLALFWCRITFNIIYQKFSQHRMFFVHVLFISICATFCGTLIFIPTDLLQGLQAMLFFGVGYSFRLYDGFNFRIGLFKLFLILLIVLFSIYSGSMSMVRCYYGYWPVNILAAIGMTLVVYRFSKVLCSMAFWGSRLLAFLGRISIVVLCVHILDLDFLPLKSFHNLLVFSDHIDIILHLIVALTVSSAIVRLSFVRKVFSLK